MHTRLQELSPSLYLDTHPANDEQQTTRTPRSPDLGATAACTAEKFCRLSIPRTLGRVDWGPAAEGHLRRGEAAEKPN